MPITLCFLLPHTDPAFNLAAEEYLFTTGRADSFMLWRNRRAIIVGRNQNTQSQINPDFVRDHDIQVVRRITGGGAVYHDLGNVNFTFIQTFSETPKIDFSHFTRPVCEYLNALGVPAIADGRNDLTVKGMKISGNAQHIHRNHVLHHGTLLFQADRELLAGAILTDPVKYADKAVRSVHGRVTNISDHLRVPISVESFVDGLFSFIQTRLKAKPAFFSAGEISAINQLAEKKYRRWEWNFGASPPYNFKKSVRTSGGTLDVRIDVRSGVIRNIRVFGDYFGIADIRELESHLIGCRHEPSAIEKALTRMDVSAYLSNISLKTLVSAMF